MESIKTVDFCSYLGEKDLLKRRINFLYDQVDKFLISEIVDPDSNNQLNEEDFDDPLNKIEIIKINLLSIQNLNKEQIQRDCLLYYLHHYDDETIFIVSDSYEIIDASIVKYYLSNLLQVPGKILRVPMVLLGNTVNTRLIDDYGNIIPWNCPFMCNKSVFDKFTPSQIRNSILKKTKDTSSLDIFIIDDGQNKDAGWNFNLVGKNIENLNYKFASYSNTIPV